MIYPSEPPLRTLISRCRSLLCSLRETGISEAKVITLRRELDLANPRQPQVTEIADSELWQFIVQVAPGRYAGIEDTKLQSAAVHGAVDFPRVDRHK